MKATPAIALALAAVASFAGNVDARVMRQMMRRDGVTPQVYFQNRKLKKNHKKKGKRK